MTTTYTATGIQLISNDFNDENVGPGQPATLQVTYDDSVTNVSYTDLGFFDFLPEVEFFPLEISATINGTPIDDLHPGFGMETLFGQFNGRQGPTYVLNFYYDPAPSGSGNLIYDYLFFIGGAEVPNFQTFAEIEAFLISEFGEDIFEDEEAIDNLFSRATGDFAAGQQIPLSSFDWDSIVDNPPLRGETPPPEDDLPPFDPGPPAVVDTGTPEADILRGGPGNDTLIGLAGDDDIRGAEGDDVLVGGPGSDTMTGGTGNDLVVGGNVLSAGDGVEGQVVRLYQATLDRAPDLGGFRAWTGRLERGEQTLLQVIEGFTGSPEFQNTFGSLSDTGFVTLLYRNVLNREPDDGGLARWTGDLAAGVSRAEVVRGFAESAEFKANTAELSGAFYGLANDPGQYVDDVFRLYQATLGREPDLGGLARWSGELAEGTSFESIAAGFTNSPEFQRDFGGQSDTAFVNLLYNNVLGRNADPQGLDRWTGDLASGVSREAVVLGFSQSPEFIQSTAADVAAFMAATDGDLLQGRGGNDILAGSLLADEFVFDADLPGRDVVLSVDPWDSLRFQDFGYTSRADVLAQMQQVGDDLVFSDTGRGVVAGQQIQVTFANLTLAELQDIQIETASILI